MKKIESSLKKHPVWSFFVFALIFTGLLGFAFDRLLDVLPGIGGNVGYQDIGNVLQATVAIAVGAAGAYVAIVLAQSALNTSERIEYNDVRSQILEKVQKTRDLTQAVKVAYKEVSFWAYQFYYVANIPFENSVAIKALGRQRKQIEQDKLIKLKEVTEQHNLTGLIERRNNTKEYEQDNYLTGLIKWRNNIKEYQELLDVIDSQIRLILPFKQIKDAMYRFANAMIELERDAFSYGAYRNGFKSFLSEIESISRYEPKGNFLVDSEKIIEMAVQIKKYTDDFANNHYHFNPLYHIGQKWEIISKMDEDLQISMIASIFIGYLVAPYDFTEDRVELLGTLIFYDMLYNLPTADDITTSALRLLSSLDETNTQREQDENVEGGDSEPQSSLTDIQKKLKKDIDILLGEEDKKFKEDIEKIANQVVKNFEEIFIYRLEE